MTKEYNSSVNRVTILCLTYNHEKYIEKTLNSFLFQKANFGFNIIINDDSSTDSTVEIINDISRRNPGRIKLIKHTANQYSKGKRLFFPRYLIPKVETEYFATCEGDDYWTDEFKLQKQVDFMDRNRDVCIFSTNARILSDGKDNGNLLQNNSNKINYFGLDDIIISNKFITCTAFFRSNESASKKAYDLLDNKDFQFSDWTLYLVWLEESGLKAAVSTMVTATYRRHNEGIFSKLNTEERIDKTIKQLMFNWKHFQSSVSVGDVADAIKELAGLSMDSRYTNELEEAREDQNKLIKEITTLKGTNLGLSKEVERLNTIRRGLSKEITNIEDELSLARHELYIVYKRPWIYFWKLLKIAFKSK